MSILVWRALRINVNSLDVCNYNYACNSINRYIVSCDVWFSYCRNLMHVRKLTMFIILAMFTRSAHRASCQTRSLYHPICQYPYTRMLHSMSQFPSQGQDWSRHKHKLPAELEICDRILLAKPRHVKTSYIHWTGEVCHWNPSEPPPTRGISMHI